jgi:type VI secretion system protein ImpG
VSESLLPAYNEELSALRTLAGEFAKAFPQVAGRLRLSPDGTVDDPHVERLLEGVAFLAARVQNRLDDELPEITDTLLDLLSPHLLAPVPSMTTIRFAPRKDADHWADVPRGTPVETEPVRGEVLRYRTCHDLRLWPVEIKDVRLMGLPIAAPANPRLPGRAAGCLRITLRTTLPGLRFDKLGMDRLRLHLRGGGPIPAAVHELLATAVLGIALADGPEDTKPTLLDAECLQTVGYAREEAALPWPRRAFDGHRLLTEYFAFPEKFLYLDLSGMEARSLVHASDRLDVFLYLSRSVPELERSLGKEAFALHCTPAVNLFPQRCEPIGMDGTRADWILLPDSRRPMALEVYAVTEVRESRSGGERRAVQPFFRLGRSAEEEESAPAQWLARRLPAMAPLTGTETRLALRDPAFDPVRPADAVLTVEALCCNRDLPELLPFGGGQPKLSLVDAKTPAESAECISAPTATLRPRLRERSAWHLVSHLALNHLGVTGGEDAAAALREMLRLHDLRDAPETRSAIASLLAVEARPGLARIPGARPGAFVRGIEIGLTFDPQGWGAGGLFGLAVVLERFLALQGTVNGFVRTRVGLRGRSGSVAAFPARSGTRTLL